MPRSPRDLKLNNQSAFLLEAHLYTICFHPYLERVVWIPGLNIGYQIILILIVSSLEIYLIVTIKIRNSTLSKVSKMDVVFWTSHSERKFSFESCVHKVSFLFAISFPISGISSLQVRCYCNHRPISSSPFSLFLSQISLLFSFQSPSYVGALCP